MSYSGKYKILKNNLKSVKHKPKTNKNTHLINDISSELNNLFNLILNKDQLYSIKWLCGLEKYNKSLHGRRKFTSNLTRGHIVEVELFGHFKSELTFAHPAVVLYDNGKFALVAPISSSLYNDDSPLHIDLRVSDGMKNNCGISLDQILTIDKDRILYQHDTLGHKLKIPDEKLDQIDIALMTHFIPKQKNLLDMQKEKINELQEELQNLKSENSALNEALIDLQKTKV